MPKETVTTQVPEEIHNLNKTQGYPNGGPTVEIKGDGKYMTATPQTTLRHPKCETPNKCRIKSYGGETTLMAWALKLLVSDRGGKVVAVSEPFKIGEDYCSDFKPIMRELND